MEINIEKDSSVTLYYYNREGASYDTLEIPSTIEINGTIYPVSEIEYFCKNCEINTLIIPDGIRIGSCAFKNCTIHNIIGNPLYIENTSGIENRNIGNHFYYDGTTKIPDGTISVCGASKLDHFPRIPNSVKYISGFNNCLDHVIVIPKNVEVLTKSFLGKLDRIYCYSGSKIYSSIKCDYLYCIDAYLANVITKTFNIEGSCTIEYLEASHPDTLPTTTKLCRVNFPEVCPQDYTIAYKGFTKGLRCRDLVYIPNKIYTVKHLSICSSGFHACYDPLNCLDYYPYEHNEFHKVKILGDRAWTYNKIATDKIEVLPETLSLEEMIEIHNNIYNNIYNNKLI